MKKILFSVFLFAVCLSTQAQIYLAKASEISFFSYSVIENIEAVNVSSKPVVNTATNDVVIKVPVTGFQFKSSLMQTHFNENYMESDKFPFAIFKGKINETIDYSQQACNKVTVTGNLNMHGTEKCIVVVGTMTVKDSTLAIEGKFKIRLDDYGIKVPSLYIKNIAEEVEIKIYSELYPYVRE
jgi:hypothetical protein